MKLKDLVNDNYRSSLKDLEKFSKKAREEKPDELLSYFDEFVKINIDPDVFLDVDEEKILPGIEYFSQYLYNYFYKNIKVDYTISDLEMLVSSKEANKIIKDKTLNPYFGLFVSMLINKYVEKNEKIEIELTFSAPVHLLLYNSHNVVAHINVAGKYFGENSKSSIIYLNEADETALKSAENVVFYAGKVKSLGAFLKNSKVYARDIYYIGGYYESAEVHVINTRSLGWNAKNSRFYAKKVEKEAGEDAEDSVFYIDDLDGEIKNGKNNIFNLGHSYSNVKEKYNSLKIFKWEKAEIENWQNNLESSLKSLNL